MKKLCHIFSDYMGILVLAAAILALLFPDFFNKVPTSTVNYMLGIVMFGMGLTLKLDDFRVLITRPRDIVIGSLAQFTIMPLLAWLLARLFNLDDALALGVILVGCSPGGTASNVITYLAKGDLALSVGITGVSTLLAPIITPLLTWLLAGKSIDVDFFSMFISILWVIIVPIILGLVIKKLFPHFSSQALDYLPAFSSLAIATIVAIVVSANAQKLFIGGFTIIVVVILHNLGGLLIGYSVGTLMGFSTAKRKTIGIEVGMQNSGLACSLATIHFAAYPMATIPGAFFSVWHNISGTIVARIFARQSSKQENELI